MAKVGRNLQWHVKKTALPLQHDQLSVTQTHYALRADGKIIQRIILLPLNQDRRIDLGWKLFAAKGKPADVLAELRGRGFEDAS